MNYFLAYLLKRFKKYLFRHVRMPMYNYHTSVAFFFFDAQRTLEKVFRFSVHLTKSEINNPMVITVRIFPGLRI